MKKLIFLMLFTFWLGSLPAEEPEASKRPVENRFLFVLESSAAMDRCSKSAVETIQKLIATGVQDQMKEDDTFGLWTFNDKLDPSFPMQRWSSAEREKLAEMTGEFLKQRRYEKKASVNGMLAPLYSVIRSSRAITVILVSTGNDPIQGTPFDNQINPVYSAHARELRKEKLPFVTILVGRNGRLVAHSVNSALGPIRIPNPPIEPLPSEKPKQEIVAATNHVVEPPPRKIAKSNIIISKESIAKESFPITESAKPVEAQTQSTAPQFAPVTSPAPSAESVSKNSANEVNAQAVESAPKAQSTLNIPPDNSAKVSINPVPTDTENATIIASKMQAGKIEKAEKQVRDSNMQITNGTTSQNTFHAEPVQVDAQTQSATEAVVAATAETKGNKFMAIGLLLVAVAIGLVFFIVRSTRGKSGPSIISSSMDGRRK